MARVPASEIARLKQEVSVERLAQARGVKLELRGADLHGLCPFHNDTSPSLVISPKKNLWNCLGACQAGGNVIDWVMKAEGVSFRHAVELLREGMPVSGVSASTTTSSVATAELPPPVDLDADDRALLRQVVGFYHQALLESPEALAYLAKRGLGDEEAIRHFQLGFANRTLGLRLPGKTVKAGKVIRGRSQSIGIVRSSGHEHFNGSIVVPVTDLDGAVVEIYGHKITPNLRAGTPHHLYLPGPHRGVWDLSAIAASKEVIVCESLLDALTFWVSGLRNVTAAYGVNGFTAEHLEALLAYGTERVLIAYDRDEAGNRASAKLAKRLGAEGIGCWRVTFPRGMDANEYALKVTPAERSLDVLLRKAVWMGEGEAPELAPSVRHTTVVGVVEPSSPAAKTAAKEENAPTASSLAALSSAPSSTELSSTDPPPSVLPSAPPPDGPPVDVRDHEVVIELGDRRYRIRGLEKNLSYDVLRINLLASRNDGDRFHVDTLDLYNARQRGAFVKQASAELGLEPKAMKREVGKVLLALEQLQDEQIQKTLEPEAKKPAMSKAEREEALALLRDPALLDRIVSDFAACGVVGEETNKLTGYLAALSRKLSRPLAVIVQSSSAAGKSSLLDAVLAFVPEEERVSYSAMTGQSLFYMGEADLEHKVLAVAEEEGAERASYALKLLQSEGELTIASTGKDPATGKHVTHEYRVKGPVAIMLTTTAIDVDEELLNRCLVLAVDEGRAQTRAIHAIQRERRTLGGLLALETRKAILRAQRNAQRLLRPLRVLNPYAPQLTFHDVQTRARRDHEKYLALIDVIALLHQHQREVKRVKHAGTEIEYVEVVPSDIEAANRLAHEVLGRTLDELPPQTRRVLELIERFVEVACAREGVERWELFFSRRTLRETLGMGDTQLRVHMQRLVDLEYLVVHQGSRGRSFVYAPSDGGRRQLSGLIDVESLDDDGNLAGVVTPPRGGKDQIRGDVAGFGGSSQGDDSSDACDPPRGVRGDLGHHFAGDPKTPASYVATGRSQVSSSKTAAAESR